MLKIRDSKLRLRGKKVEEFTWLEIRSLATFLIDVTDYKDEVKKYYTAKINNNPLDSIEEHKSGRF